MPHVELDRWSMEYETICNPPTDPAEDLQFGMAYELTYSRSNTDLALVQLINPATDVLKNLAGRWNVDNRDFHDDDRDLVDAVFANDGRAGRVRDRPTEIVRPADHPGTIETRFAVFVVDPQSRRINRTGLGFGYRTARNRSGIFEVTFSGLKTFDMSPEQRRLFCRVRGIKFV